MANFTIFKVGLGLEEMIHITTADAAAAEAWRNQMHEFVYHYVVAATAEKKHVDSFIVRFSSSSDQRLLLSDMLRAWRVSSTSRSHQTWKYTDNYMKLYCVSHDGEDQIQWWQSALDVSDANFSFLEGNRSVLYDLL